MKSKKKAIFITIFVLIVIGFLYYFVQYQKLSKNTGTQANAASEEKTKEAVDKISKLIYIKDTSNAVLATITDKTKLAEQKFFEFADNGDYVVVFPATSQAVIYRPSINKIIGVTLIAPPTDQNSQVQNPAATVSTVTASTTHKK